MSQSEESLYEAIVAIAIAGDPQGRPNRNSTQDIFSRCKHVMGVNNSSIVYRAIKRGGLVRDMHDQWTESIF